MKLKIILSVFTVFVLLSFNEPAETKTELDRTVYVCGKSKIYHPTKSHNALKRCKSGIKTMTESKAKSQGKRICKCKS